MLIRKQTLDALDIASWANLNDQEFNLRLEAANLHQYHSWLLPQLVASFGTWRLYNTGKQTVVENCKHDHERALYRISRSRRSLLIKNQTQNPDYGQLTPLVLLGFKRSQGYSYEQFRKLPGLEWLLEPDLYNSLILEELPQIPQNRLLEIRHQGLLYKTGKDAGKTRLAEQTWQLYGIQGTELSAYPKLTQTILAQIWLAHPKHRCNTMILDLWDWDSMPEPLIDTEVVYQKPTAPKTLAANLPWLD